MNLNKLMLTTAIGLGLSQTVLAGTEPFFTPLTDSATVGTPNDANEINAPWLTPAGFSQNNLTSLFEVDNDPSNQSVVRRSDIDGLGTRSDSMFDMSAYDETGRYIFIPHETSYGAGASRYDTQTDTMKVIFKGDGAGPTHNDWSQDYGAFDPATYTPNGTLLVAEEWSGEGRVFEVLNPKSSGTFTTRELESMPNVSHEGLRFSKDGKTLYFVDESRSGSLYKIVFRKKGDYSLGQVFVLKIDAYNGDPTKNYNDVSNENEPRTGKASWIPLTDSRGNPLTEVSPFRNGTPNSPRYDGEPLVGGRVAADEVNATPYGRPEDIEVSQLANNHEVLYFAATSESTIYAVIMDGKLNADVQVFASESATAKNVGFPSTTGTLSSPDNLAQDAWGNIYIIEDKPNGDAVGGDVWFARDVDGDGVAESLDHMMSVQVDGSEATGMIFNPSNPCQFVISVQHPDSTNLDNHPTGFGDALWQFDISNTRPSESQLACN